MSDRTSHLQELDRRYIWHPFTQMSEWESDDPLVIERGEGSWLIDTDGNRYLDGVASMWTNVHGHCRSELNEALKAQVDFVRGTPDSRFLVQQASSAWDGRSTVMSVALDFFF